MELSPPLVGELAAPQRSRTGVTVSTSLRPPPFARLPQSVTLDGGVRASALACEVGVSVRVCGVMVCVRLRCGRKRKASGVRAQSWCACLVVSIMS